METDKKEVFDPILANEAQVKRCKEKGLPHFAPVGTCWKCKQNIYLQIDREFKDPSTGYVRHYTTGISVKEAGETLITGCPHCNRTFCD